MRYIVYARKSSESEERQAQSIDDQLRELRFLAKERHLDVVAEYTEARSAKAPGGRPVFSEVIASVQAGEADAILCWHVNRLFRNPVDFGTVSWLLQTGALQEIHTPHQVYRTADNVLLLSVENGMANQFILDLKKAVVRGMQSKVEKGVPPQLAPEGYINNIRLRTIEPDPERFPLIRKAWDLMLTGAYTVPQVIRVLNEEWGYRTISRRKNGGIPLSRSSGYRLFGNLFYTGHFIRDGRVCKGAYRPMITLQEYETVREIFSRQGRQQPKKRAYTYTGMIHCGRCGCAITAEMQKGRVYYHCTNARKICDKRGLTQEEMDRQLMRELRSICISPETEALLLDVIARFDATPKVELEEQCVQTASRLKSHEEELGELVLMRARKLIDDQGLAKGQDSLNKEIMALRKSLASLQAQVSAKHDSVRRAVHFATHVQEKFTTADVWTKRRIVQGLGSNYLLVGKALTVQKQPVLQFIADHRGAVEQEIMAFEKRKTAGITTVVAFGGPYPTLSELLRLGNAHPFGHFLQDSA